MDWTDISNITAWEIWLDGFGWGLGWVGICLVLKIIAWIAKPRGSFGSTEG